MAKKHKWVNCHVLGCPAAAQGRGLCSRHYDYFRREVKHGRASWKTIEESGYKDERGDDIKLYEYVFGAESRTHAREIAFNLVRAEGVKPGLEEPNVKPHTRMEARRFLRDFCYKVQNNTMIPLVNRTFSRRDATHSYILAVFGRERDEPNAG